MHKTTKSSKTNTFYWTFFVFQKLFSTLFQILYSNHASLLSVGAERGRYRFSLYAERGCDDMKPASFETAIRLQFDTLVKRVIDCTVKNYEKELNRRSKREVLFVNYRRLSFNPLQSKMNMTL